MAKKKRKISAAEKSRLKALRRKHGLGEFRKSKKSRSKVRKSRTTRTTKTKRRVSPMPKRKTTKRRSRSFTSGLEKPVVSGVTYALLQPIMSQLLSKVNIGTQDEFVQIIGAIVLKNTVKNTIVTNWANAAIIVNTASLASGLSGNLFNSGSSSTGSSSNGGANF